MMKLSTKALDALVNAGTNRQGAKVTSRPEVIEELRKAGQIAEGDGLTRAGTITREREMSVRMDEMFG
jgi:hypothetical protein